MGNKSRQIDSEIKDICSGISRSNLALKVKMLDIQDELKEWNLYGDLHDQDEGNNLSK